MNHQTRKSTSKRLGVQTIVNNNNNIFVFSNNQPKTKSVQLADEHQQLIEQNNDLDNFKTNLGYGNIKFGLSNNALEAFYPNQYTIHKKSSSINQWLVQKYCPAQCIDSNLILQLIHNNEDFKKIIALYLDMVFSMKVFKGNRNEDYISKIFNNMNAKEIIDKVKSVIDSIKKRPYLFGFNPKDSASDQKIAYHLKNISMLRNHIAHDSNDNLRIDSDVYASLTEQLDQFIEQENEKFTEQNGHNLALISQFYPSWSDEEVVKNYHDYYFNMLDKNLGVNLRQIALLIREKNNIGQMLDDDRRAKFNVVLKFYLYTWLKANQAKLDDYIQQLRQAQLDDKDAIYQKIAQDIPANDINRLIKLCQQIDFQIKPTRFKRIPVKTINEQWDCRVLMIYSLTKFLTIKETNELISALLNKIEAISNLLEIDRVLKLQAVDAIQPNQRFFASLPMPNKPIKQAKQTQPKQQPQSKPANGIRGLAELRAQLQPSIAPSASPDNQSTQCQPVTTSLKSIDYERIARQLTIVNRIRSYHQPKHAEYHRQELIDAISLFWGSDELCITDGIFDEEIKVLVNGSTKPVSRKLKNILRNNVIKTKFFNYIIRYIEPKKVANLLHGNYGLALFLVQQLTPSQLESLMNEYIELEDENQLVGQTPREELTEMQKQRLEQYEHQLAMIFSEKNLFDVLRESQNNGRKISFIKPYLTCIYLLIKNLNRINAYYLIAFAMYERDYRLSGLPLFQYKKKDDPYFNTKMTEMILSNNKKYHQVFANLDKIKQLDLADYQAILSDQPQKGLKNLFKEYRNQVMHYNVVDYLLNRDFHFPDQFEYRNYFRIYQWLLQNSLLDMEQSGEINTFTKVLSVHRANLTKYQCYSKDLTYQLNLLFAYNYARYKDLSDEHIFNRKY